MIREGISYFTDVGVIWNFFDVFSAICTIIFCICDMFDIYIGEYLYVIGALGVFFLWLKLFYFLRLFKATSFFVRMIIEMILDIKVILFVFFIAIFAFSNSYYLLGQAKAF